MVPSFETVPEHWKHPVGPYRQAPVAYGGKWWHVSPFTGEEPWVRFQTPIEEPDYPEGFLAIFGPRPEPKSPEDRLLAVEWDQELQHFKQAGLPPDSDKFPHSNLANATAAFEAWGMGAPKFYEGRYGWRAAFPDGPLRWYDVDALGAVAATHLVIAQYQVRLVSEGMTPKQRHPFVPPQIWGE